VEVTEFLKKENRLLLYVNNTRKGDQVPSFHYDWFNYGGIHRNVELFELPKAFIRRFQLNFVKGSNYSKLEYSILIEGKMGTKLIIKIPELEMDKEIEVQNMQLGTNEIRGTIEISNISNIKLWSPETPKLYEVLISYDDDILEENIGFREIETKGTEILLNGNKVFLKGMCVHEESYEKGRVVSERDINRASVIIWSIGNKNPDSDDRYHFMSNLSEIARMLDRSRLIGAS